MPRYTIGELHSPEFNNRYFFDGTLGALHATDGTTFRLWAPTAWRVVLNVHSGPDAGTYPMTPDQPHPGVWEYRLSGDQAGAEYTYTLVFEAGGSETESVDPYARAVTANGQRGVVVNVDKLLGQATRMPSFGPASDAIIYELHVRDLTISPENGITHKGKF